MEKSVVSIETAFQNLSYNQRTVAIYHEAILSQGYCTICVVRNYVVIKWLVNLQLIKYCTPNILPLVLLLCTRSDSSSASAIIK